MELVQRLRQLFFAVSSQDDCRIRDSIQQLIKPYDTTDTPKGIDISREKVKEMNDPKDSIDPKGSNDPTINNVLTIMENVIDVYKQLFD